MFHLIQCEHFREAQPKPWRQLTIVPAHLATSSVNIADRDFPRIVRMYDKFGRVSGRLTELSLVDEVRATWVPLRYYMCKS